MVQSVVGGGLSQAGAAELFNTTPKTVAKWVKRFRAEGVEMALGDLALLVDGIREQQLEDRVGSEIEIGLL
jgi:predicted peroxiredoxin